MERAVRQFEKKVSLRPGTGVKYVTSNCKNIKMLNYKDFSLMRLITLNVLFSSRAFFMSGC